MTTYKAERKQKRHKLLQAYEEREGKITAQADRIQQLENECSDCVNFVTSRPLRAYVEANHSLIVNSHMMEIVQQRNPNMNEARKLRIAETKLKKQVEGLQKELASLNDLLVQEQNTRYAEAADAAEKAKQAHTQYAWDLLDERGKASEWKGKHDQVFQDKQRSEVHLRLQFRDEFSWHQKTLSSAEAAYKLLEKRNSDCGEWVKKHKSLRAEYKVLQQELSSAVEQHKVCFQELRNCEDDLKEMERRVNELKQLV
ncbi:hypothetical protein LTS18_013444 [Coniosporium uncinatum]|uniref:Uncharacterized protein n=1 Tax=Coniosporium uncinatum TaxID=93489 RepID=A0ACC3CWQ1_9PEZI|nr:hypothetical protein LTS18_013444 [Coniosporium uncinatum]